LSGKGFAGFAEPPQNFLPEKHSDFIVTNYAEEFGFVGSVALLPVRGGDRLRRQTAMAAGASQLRPACRHGRHAQTSSITSDQWRDGDGPDPGGGIPMPLLSYGGTAMLSVMFGFGLG